ncbi:MAG: hypothetical protein ACR2HQ_15280 [Ilumatobacteraceae bacterium]
MEADLGVVATAGTTNVARPDDRCGQLGHPVALPDRGQAGVVGVHLRNRTAGDVACLGDDDPVPLIQTI